MSNMSQGTRRVVFCAVALALSYVTSLIKLFSLPLGGDVTLFSMLFIVLAGNWYGVGAGIIVGVAYSLLSFMVSPSFLSVPQFLLDYIFAFGALGLGGLCRNQKNGLVKGYIIAILARGIFTSLARYCFWMEYMPDTFPRSIAFLYPVNYNYSYILAEGLLTVIVISIPAVRDALARIRMSAVGSK